MSLPINRYALDPTGQSPDNKVVGEVHELSTRDIRAVAPIYGAFFAESLVVYDHISNQELVRGTHYQCVELLQDASATYGKEIVCLILILDKAVSNQVRIDVQYLGGHFQNDTAGIVNMYETALKDDRPVKWENILGRPMEFPPTLHLHLLNDVVGFQAVVAALERIRNAIILSDVPAFEALIDWVNNRIRNIEAAIADLYVLVHRLDLVENLPVVTEREIICDDEPHSYVTQDRLMFALRYYGLLPTINLSFSKTEIPEGSLVTVDVATSNIDPNAVLYWGIDHHGTDAADFGMTAGIINTSNNHGSFKFVLHSDRIEEPTEHFKVCIHMKSPTGPVIKKSEMLSALNVTWNSALYDRITPAMMRMCSYRTPMMPPTPTSMHVILTPSRRG